MAKYAVNLPRVDEHEQGEEFVSEILKLSNHVDDDGRPVFVTEDLNEAFRVVRETCEICRRHYGTTEFDIGIVLSEKERAKGCQT
jgi:Ethanolamine utilization protein EutJ (predicted chaperonin)